MSKLEVTSFDIAEYLDKKEVIAEYLTQILADGDTMRYQCFKRQIIIPQEKQTTFCKV